MDFNQSKTKENLARAFAAECQDGARYQFIAKSAKSEGFSFISDQIKMLAKNEMAHASAFYGLMIEHLGGSKEDNVAIEAGYPFEPTMLKVGLERASEIEFYESKNLYPSFAKIAKDEGFIDVHDIFMLVSKVETRHGEVLGELAKLYNTNKLYKRSETVTWTCSNCGYKESGKEAWKICALCKYPQGHCIIPMESN